MSQELQRAIEKALLNDLDKMCGLMTDLRLLGEFMRLYELDDANMSSGIHDEGLREERLARRAFLNQRFAIRHQQVLAARSVFSTKVVTK